MRENGVVIQDIRKRHGGNPYLLADGYVIPLELSQGLLQLRIRLPTEQELNTCCEVELTSSLPWEPHELKDEQLTPKEYEDLCNSIFDLDGVRNMNLMWSRNRPQEVTMAEPYLLYPGELTAKKTLEATTQLGTISTRIPLHQHRKSRNPLLNCNRLMEEYATDTWFWKVKSYEGYKCNQLFFGCSSKKFANFGMQTESNGPEALLDFFRQEGVPISIRSDNSKMQTGYM